MPNLDSFFECRPIRVDEVYGRVSVSDFRTLRPLSQSLLWIALKDHKTIHEATRIFGRIQQLQFLQDGHLDNAGSTGLSNGTDKQQAFAAFHCSALPWTARTPTRAICRATERMKKEIPQRRLSSGDLHHGTAWHTRASYCLPHTTRHGHASVEDNSTTAASGPRTHRLDR